FCSLFPSTSTPFFSVELIVVFAARRDNRRHIAIVILFRLGRLALGLFTVIGACREELVRVAVSVFHTCFVVRGVIAGVMHFSRCGGRYVGQSQILGGFRGIQEKLILGNVRFHF